VHKYSTMSQGAPLMTAAYETLKEEGGDLLGKRKNTVEKVFAGVSDVVKAPGAFKKELKKLRAEGGVTWMLTLWQFIASLGLFITSILWYTGTGQQPVLASKNPSSYIVSAYLIAFSLLSLVVIPERPQCLTQFGHKWFPFLFTYRGRGAFSIFCGTLCCGFGVFGVAFGVIAIGNGFAHIVCACFFKNKLKKKPYAVVTD